MSVESALQALRLEPRFMRNIVRWERIPARAAQTEAIPPGLDDRLAAALLDRGIAALYTHQAAAVRAALNGEHVVVATPAASGKTLCYNLPVLHRLLAEPGSRALYLFPTKALSHDQLAELIALAAAAGIRALPAAYDGDTPSAQRARIRDTARALLSNPDMLHAGILPQHPRWAAFFASLRVVVIDEMHVYRGVFGSHVANVLRRLRRICRFYGSTPQFILASATIANPGELATRLVEAPVSVVGGSTPDGAPQGERNILFYNPPVVDPDLGIRRSTILESADLAAHFLEHGVQTIVFGRARLAAELMVTHLREASPAHVRGYRGGYLPSDRREIEQGLRSGQVRGVVATNALELGIDIGHLDAAVLAGHPGTIASARQQMGRAGRRQGASVAVLVAGPGPLDQYVVTHPRWLLERSPEHARINPDNGIILAGHLACAAAELPLQASEELGAAQPQQSTGAAPGISTASLLADLAEAGQLYLTGERYFWAGQGNPAQTLGLRSAGEDRIVIQTRESDGRSTVIGELDREGVPLLLYEGAIYLHEGVSHVVERLDWEAGIATVRAIEADFYTRPILSEKIEILATRGSMSGDDRPYELGWGDLRVTSQASRYRILRRNTGEVLGFGEIDLPDQILETQGCWISFPERTIETLKAIGQWLSDPNDYGPQWGATRDAVRQRDGHRCQGCGALEMGGRQHDVHHKIPFRAFVADATRRENLPADLAWQAANRLENLVTLCPSCHHLAESGVRTRSGLGGAAALIEGVAPLFLMCDGRDLGINPEPEDPTTGMSTITVYERTPGGVGYAEQLFATIPDVLQAALDLLTGCPCETGCPACVGPVLEHEYALDTKALTEALLRAALFR